MNHETLTGKDVDPDASNVFTYYENQLPFRNKLFLSVLDVIYPVLKVGLYGFYYTGEGLNKINQEAPKMIEKIRAIQLPFKKSNF